MKPTKKSTSTKTAKKTMKAVTLLARIEVLLGDVLHECSAVEKSVEKEARELLLSAEELIGKAKEFVAPAPAIVPRKRTVRSVKAVKTVARARRHAVVRAA